MKTRLRKKLMEMTGREQELFYLLRGYYLD